MKKKKEKLNIAYIISSHIFCQFSLVCFTTLFFLIHHEFNMIQVDFASLFAPDKAHRVEVNAQVSGLKSVTFTRN